jgi:putative oxidoreductase
MNTETSDTPPSCSCCGQLDAVFTALAPLGPLLARLAIGIVFLAHGSQKMFGWFGGNGWSGTIGFMHDKLGIPAAFAALAIIAEFFGGLGVLVGLLTRLAAFGIFCVMAVAVTQVHLSNGFFADKHGFEYPLTLGLVALSLIFTGPGPWSLDAVVCRLCKSRK